MFFLNSDIRHKQFAMFIYTMSKNDTGHNKNFTKIDTGTRIFFGRLGKYVAKSFFRNTFSESFLPVIDGLRVSKPLLMF